MSHSLRIVLPLFVIAAVGNLVWSAPPAVIEDAPAEVAGDSEKASEKESVEGKTEDVAAAEEEAPKQTYIRIARDEDENPVSLDTSVITFEASGEKHKGITVDLVGAVHVGDVAYYEKLNELFETYDVLLYELVAPEGTRVPKGGRKGGGAIGLLQGGMSSLLELEHQLEQVDYTKDNFVHADMSPEEFAKSMKDRGESFWAMFFKAMGQSAAQSGRGGKQQISDADLLMAMFAKDRSLRLKRLIARQFEDMESQMSIFDGPDGSTIITERNKKCFEVLKEHLGKGHKRIGVFYGAGHLADMEKRMAEDFAMERTGEKWIAAWDLTAKEKSPETPKEADAPAEEGNQPEADDRDPLAEPAPLKKAG